MPVMFGRSMGWLSYVLSALMTVLFTLAVDAFMQKDNLRGYGIRNEGGAIVQMPAHIGRSAAFSGVRKQYFCCKKTVQSI